MKALKIASVAIALVAIILALPLLLGLPMGVFASAIQDRVERETGYRLDIAGPASLNIWPSLNATLADVTLHDPRDHDGNTRLTISRIRAEVSASSLLSGRPRISHLVVENPVLHLPLLRERGRDIPPHSSATARNGNDSPLLIDRLTIRDGAVILSNPRDRVEERVDGIGADAVTSPDNKLMVTGSARMGEHPLKFDIKADAPSLSQRQSIPVEFNIDMPNALRAPLSGHAELRLNGKVVTINSLSGMLDGGAFNGWASIDLATKPLVKLDLDFRRLAVGSEHQVTTDRSSGWSNAPLDLKGLNYVDATVKLSAAELNAAGAHLGPVELEASLAGGVLKTTIGSLGAYGGQASGEIVVDAASANPVYTLRCDLAGLRALPLLQNLADFDRLDAKMQAKLALQSNGASQQAIMSNLSGSASLMFQDGAIRGINVAQMIRSLTSNPLSGWQQSAGLSTDFAQLSASFLVERGQAKTSDLDLIGPLVKVTGAGTIDLANQALALRAEPKLVMTTEGQGRTSDPVGLGIPVVIDGSWAQPRFYPDIAGILDNPEAAYARLKQMGQGLFGKDGPTLDNLINGIGGLIGGATSNGVAAPNTDSSGGTTPAAPNAPANQPAPDDLLGGPLGAAIGNLIQQGLQQGARDGSKEGAKEGSKGRGRSLVPPPDNSSQDSEPMNDVLKQLLR